jgi:hypothetical protein
MTMAVDLVVVVVVVLTGQMVDWLQPSENTSE